MAGLVAEGSWRALLSLERREEIAPVLLDYAAQRRWFRGKARKRVGAEIEDVVPIGSGDAGHLVVLLRVDYEDGGAETYVLPLTLASREQAAHITRKSPQAIVAAVVVRDPGSASEGGARGLLVDALATEELALALLDGLRNRRAWTGEAGELVAAPLRVFDELLEESGGDLRPRLAGAEQSNTSIFYGTKLFLKVFRIVEEGPSADYEIGRFLTERRGFRGTARLAGGIEYRWHGREAATFAMLQELIPNEGDAWEHTLKRIDELFAQVQSKGAAAPFGEPPPMPSGSLLDWSQAEVPAILEPLFGASMASARRLGERTAELHLALAEDRTDPAFAPEPFVSSDQQLLFWSAEELLGRTMDALRGQLAAAPEGARGLAEATLAREGEVHRRLREVAEGTLNAAKIRCHGDYHLGQVLVTGDDFIIIDFEGEPGRKIAERRKKSSPLRDVAGMLRSFHYAGAAALRKGRGAAEDAGALEAWAEAWSAWMSAAYLRGYLARAKGAPFLPQSEKDTRRLLEFFLLDKCVYEIGYELNNRPDWLEIPLRGLAQILGSDRGEGARVADLGAAERPSGQGRPERSAPSLPEAGESFIGDLDLHLFHEGTHTRLHEKLGAHPARQNGVEGVFFGVWAPNAERVSVIGVFNGWDASRNVLSRRGTHGVWEGFVPGAKVGDVYKLHIESRISGYRVDKADPFGFRQQAAPDTGSIVWTLDYTWNDAEWMRSRAARSARGAPISIYEVHLGSWMRAPEEGNRMLTYREIAPRLSEYARRLGFTHVELLPVTEHPFYGSWGYETTGYFAATSRYGTPQDLMFLIDTLHRDGIGVILDWVPAHFPTDEHGLGYFDGTHLFEHADPRQGLHKDWNTFIFNYGRTEVRAFLISSALFWLHQFHVDGLRVDGVASMLYLDYGRSAGEWVPNVFGGRENLEAVGLLKQLNDAICREVPDAHTTMIAEESTSWPLVSRPTHVGGLGFGMKWDLGWMHDTLDYLAKDPIYRRYHHNLLTFRNMYAFHESFVVPLSHDEVVHGKGSLILKMNGDAWQKFANLRLLYAYMWSQPGKKLLFMGGEIAQVREWNHDASLDWGLLDEAPHRQIQLLVGELNRIYKQEPSLHELDFDPRGFAWIDANDSEHSVLAFERKAKDPDDVTVMVFNLTPVPRQNYRIGVPYGGHWKEVLNTDAVELGGTGRGNLGGVEAVPVQWHGRAWSLNLTLPPLGAIFLQSKRPKRARSEKKKA